MVSSVPCIRKAVKINYGSYRLVGLGLHRILTMIQYSTQPYFRVRSRKLCDVIFEESDFFVMRVGKKIGPTPKYDCDPIHVA